MGVTNSVDEISFVFKCELFVFKMSTMVFDFLEKLRSQVIFIRRMCELMVIPKMLELQTGQPDARTFIGEAVVR